MEKITILSPHRDDSSFSLGLALSFWGAAAVKLQVVNFFTRSTYAPRSLAKTIEEVSAVREEEDRRALAFIHSSIEVTSLALLDAPLRLDLPFSQVTEEQSAQRISREEFRELSRYIQQHCANSLTIAPLGLGNHVDHIAVHKAAVDSLPPQNTAFYEDLPYATWTPAADLQARIESVQRATGTQLEPWILQTQNAVRQKRQIASFYQSQITAEEADNIAEYAETYRSGERLWLPVGSESWKAIRLLAIEPPQTAIPCPPK
jgi:LmbE family N-acetylglucosaminyl deacetylase